jgi:hypothetical protein
MKVSASVLCSLLAAAWLAAHLPSLAPSLEDIDSINFALGLRDFDVAAHQPHPPGSPVFMAMGRASLAVIRAVAPSLGQVRAEALALAIWSAIGGAIALVAAWRLCRTLDPPHPAGDPPRAAWHDVAPWAAALLGVAPLFWINGLRPMSDMAGLALVLTAQALLVIGMTSPRALLGGALIAGLSAGVRLQAAALTMPLLLVGLIAARRARMSRLMRRAAAAYMVGILAWAVPLVVASGGVDAYLRALGSQAGQDFAWVDMLWANPTPRRVASALRDTFVQPWSHPGLAIGIGIAAAAGAMTVAVRNRRALWLMFVAFGPYAVFHLLLQETVTVRYALPLLVPVCWLAVCGADAVTRLRRTVRPIGAAAAALLVLAAAWVSVPIGVVYGREAHPAFRAIADMEARARTERPVAIYSHYALRRPLQAAPPSGVRVVEPTRSFEWMGLVDYWRDGGEGPVWFLADPRRTDLALIDPQSRRSMTAYRWSVGDHPELGGTRPDGVDWYRFVAPGWFAAEGWSLTPEIGGITRLEGTGPDRRSIDAFIRRRSEPMHLVVGGRHLGSAADGPVTFDLVLDGERLETWALDPARDGLNFLRFIDVPGGIPEGERYARLTIRARVADPAGPVPPVAIRQFDIQPARQLIYGFGEGWHEAEYDNATGVSWRWTSARAVLRIAPAGAIVIRLRGESPLKYVASAPRVRVMAGDREIAATQPGGDFVWRVVVPADAVAAAGGAIAIETDQVYLPGQVEGTGDERRLGLRLFEIDVHPAAP